MQKQYFHLPYMSYSLNYQKMATFQTLAGFRDFYPQDCAIRNFIFQKFRETAKMFGFEEYDAPILETTDLFTTKSGEEIITQLFNFVDKGGRAVAMRPEMTPSLARMVGSCANAMKRPIKWFNIGEAFRYERPQKGRLRSFYQFNVDLLGEKAISADAEIIALAVNTLKSFGLTNHDFHIRLSDRKIWSLFVQMCGVQENNIHDVLSIIDKMERTKEEDVISQLNTTQDINGTELFKKITQIKSIKSLDDLQNVIEQFNNQQSDIAQRISEFSQLMDKLSMLGVSDYITIDFNIVRGLAYYTGFVFEAFERTGKSRALAGGGRYDDLVKKLGYNDLPAVGFAIGDVTLGNLLQEKDLLPNVNKKIDAYVVFSTKTEKTAMEIASQLRACGHSVEYSLKESSFSKQLSQASQSHAQYAIICGEEEAKNESVKLKDLITGNETVINISDLNKYLQHD